MSRVRALSAIERILAITALCALGACGDQGAPKPTEPASSGDLLDGPSPSATLVECPTSETKTKTAEIGALGGILSIDGTSVVFPEGALPGLTTVTLTIPASRFVEIAIKANGVDYFPVVQPIVTISYSRCNRNDVLLKPLTAWYIDAETKELLEEMTGVDNKLTRSVTFTTSHFSGYAIAF
jgi:hypothetical protein